MSIKEKSDADPQSSKMEAAKNDDENKNNDENKNFNLDGLEGGGAAEKSEAREVKERTGDGEENKKLDEKVPTNRVAASVGAPATPAAASKNTVAKKYQEENNKSDEGLSSLKSSSSKSKHLKSTNEGGGSSRKVLSGTTQSKARVGGDSKRALKRAKNAKRSQETASQQPQPSGIGQKFKKLVKKSKGLLKFRPEQVDKAMIRAKQKKEKQSSRNVHAGDDYFPSLPNAKSPTVVVAQNIIDEDGESSFDMNISDVKVRDGLLLVKNSDNNGKVIVGGRPFWRSKAFAADDESDTVTDDALPLASTVVLDVAAKKMELMEPPEAEPTFDRFGDLSDMKARNKDWFHKDLIFANTVRSIIDSMGVEGSHQSERRNEKFFDRLTRKFGWMSPTKNRNEEQKKARNAKKVSISDPPYKTVDYTINPLTGQMVNASSSGKNSDRKKQRDSRRKAVTKKK